MTKTGDWEQCVQQLLDCIVLWFPCDGEGQQPKGEVRSLLYVGDESPSLDDRLDVSNYATDIRSPGETPGALY